MAELNEVEVTALIGRSGEKNHPEPVC